MPRRRYAFTLLAFAFSIRFLAVLALRNIRKFHGMQGGADAVEFNTLGLHLASGLGYCVRVGHLSAFRAPGFPFLLSLLYRIRFESYPLVYCSLCAIGALTCVVVYCIAAHVLTDNQARVAGVVAALDFSQIYSCTLLLSECLFIFLVSLVVLCILRYLATESFLVLAAAGACLGYASLTRPAAFLLLPILVLVIICRNRERLFRSVLPVILFGLFTTAVIAPWAVRNYQVFGKFVLFTTNGGSTFYGSNNDIVSHDPYYLGSWVPTTILPHRDWIVAAPDEVEHDAREMALGKKWVREHLAIMPFLELCKVLRLWLPDASSGNRVYRLAEAVTYVPELVLSLFGIAVCLRKPNRTVAWCAIHSLVAMTLLTALIFYGSDRFRSGALPALAIYAALGAATLANRWFTARVPVREPAP